jgi:hypothetical protein
MSSVSLGLAKQIMYVLRILCYNGSLVTWTVVCLTAAKFKPLIFSLSGLALSCAVNTFILMILYDFGLSSAPLDDVEKRKFLPPPGLELLSLSRPAGSQ